jgi:DNA ligase-1
MAQERLWKPRNAVEDMMTTTYRDALQVLENLQAMGDKRKVKTELLKENRDNPVLQEIFLRTYDWERTYGLRVRFHTASADPKQAAQRTKPLFGEAARETKDAWASFTELLDKFAARKLTGQAAKDAWGLLVSRLSEQEHQWFSRILNRDLKIKATDSTVEEIWPDLIRPFGCQLAKSVKDVGEFTPTKKEPWLGWPVVVEPKLDGMRVLIEYNHEKETCTAYSREGHLLPYIQDPLDRLAAFLTDRWGQSCWVDCEGLAGDFNQTMSLIKKEDIDPVERQKLQFHVFDMVTSVAEDKRPLSERHKTLRELFRPRDGNAAHKAPPEQFILLRRKTCEAMDEVLEYYNGLLDQGYEGVMLKFNAPYRAKRTTAWLKLKPTNTVEAKVTGFEAGKQGSKNEKRLGAFVARRLDTGAEIRIGGGFKDAQRDEFWGQRDALLGTIVEFKEEARKGAETTVNFPRFVRLRPDRSK